MKVKVTLTHTDLVNLMCGRPGPFGEGTSAKYIGNQWNAAWEWDRDKFRACSVEELAKMYFGYDFEVVEDDA